MSQQDTGTQTPPAPPPPPTPDPLQQLNTWAQSIAAAEKNQGKTQAIREVADTLGMTVDEAKAFIEQVKTKEREGLAEADRKLAEANDKETAASRREDAANRRELNAEVRAQLVEAGMTRDQASQAVGLITVDVDEFVKLDTDTAKTKLVAAQVDGLKKSWPQLFPEEEEHHEETDEGKGKGAGAGNATGGKPPDSTPRGKPPAKPAGGQTDEDKAREMLLRRHPDTVKSNS